MNFWLALLPLSSATTFTFTPLSDAPGLASQVEKVNQALEPISDSSVKEILHSRFHKFECFPSQNSANLMLGDMQSTIRASGSVDVFTEMIVLGEMATLSQMINVQNMVESSSQEVSELHSKIYDLLGKVEKELLSFHDQIRTEQESFEALLAESIANDPDMDSIVRILSLDFFTRFITLFKKLIDVHEKTRLLQEHEAGLISLTANTDTPAGITLVSLMHGFFQNIGEDFDVIIQKSNLGEAWEVYKLSNE